MDDNFVMSLRKGTLLKNFIPSIIGSILTLNVVPALSSNWHPYAITGLGRANPYKTQNVTLQNTPSPGVENQFESKDPSNYTAIVGLGAKKDLKALKFKTTLSAGMEALYLNDTEKGIVRPLINVGPNFDQLNYSFSVNSLVLLAKATLTRDNLLQRWAGYADFGFGASFNGFSNYMESIPTGSTAIPMATPFHRRMTEELAFSIGLGFTHKVANRSEVSIGYKYLYAGTGALGTSATQGTTHHLSYSDLGYQLITVSVSI
jgi:hypothetical protein